MKSKRSRVLTFSTTGEFVTELAREWFWVKKKPWSTVERLLLACLSGTDEPRVELVKLARDKKTGWPHRRRDLRHDRR